MYHLSDKDLDRLSKEAAEKYEVESTTSGWEAVEDQLNKEIPPNTNDRRRRRFLFFLLFFVLFCGTGLTWMLSNSESFTRISASARTDANETDQPVVKSNTSDNNNTISDNTINNEQTPITKDHKTNKNNSIDELTTGNKITDQESIKANDQQSTVKTDQESKQQDRSKPLIHSPEQTTNNKLATVQPRLTVGETKPASNNRQIIPSDSKNRSRKQNIAADLDLQNAKDAKDLKPKNLAGIIRPRQAPNVQKNVRPFSTDQDLVSAKLGPGYMHPPLQSKNRRSNGVPRGLQFGLAYAPDYSNVKFTHRDKVGFNAGLTISYRFNRRWSVNTGAIITKKNYTAYGKDYHPPKDYWTYNVYLNTVNANCNMIDIPLNVRYDFISNKKNHAFLSTGFSTYFMNKETYDYHFTYNGIYGREKRSYDDKTKHWFSILNVSTGYERRINKRFSLQLEPYLKIPVKGLGFGKVDLNSYGAYFSVKYQLLSK